MNTYAWILSVLALAQAISVWRLWRAGDALTGLSARLVRQHEALALLTETSEAGFEAVAREIGRIATAPRPSPRKPSTRRIKAAAQRGRKIDEIAAGEEVSEGEVRLRLQMASGRAKGDGRHAGLRA